MSHIQPHTQRPRVFILGGGVAGCAAAAFLADGGVPVVLAERAAQLGGKARTYGCKATNECQNCGVCLLGGLFEKVEDHPLIEVLTSAIIKELRGDAHSHTVVVRTAGGTRQFGRLAAVVVATGFEGLSNSLADYLDVTSRGQPAGVLTGSQLEVLMGQRGLHQLLASPPESVAFLGCFGTRKEHEDSFFCSRVCCAYTTRAAKLLRQYYPTCRLAYFYMEIQTVSGGDWMEELASLGVELIQIRPDKITAGPPASLSYNDPTSGFTTRSFDLIVLSEGIHPPAQNIRLAKLLGLSLDENGFLTAGPDAMARGLFAAGCARLPLRIEETYADAQRVAMDVLATLRGEDSE